MKLALAIPLLVTSSTVVSSVSSGTVVDHINNNNNKNKEHLSALPNQRVAGVDINTNTNNNNKNNNKGGGGRRLGLGNLLSGLGKGLGLSPKSNEEEGLIEETVEKDVVVVASTGSSSGHPQPQQGGSSTKPTKSLGSAAVVHGPNHFEIGPPEGLPPDLLSKTEEVSNVPKDKLDPSIGALVVDVPGSKPLSVVTPKDDTPANNGENGENSPPFGAGGGFGLGAAGGLGLSSTGGGGGGFGLGSVGGLGLSSSEANVEPDGGVTLADLGINETETTMEGGGFNPVESSTDGATLYGVGDHEGGYAGLDYDDAETGTYEEILYVSDTDKDEDMFPSTGVDESEDPIMQELNAAAAAVDESVEETAIRKFSLFCVVWIEEHLPNLKLTLFIPPSSPQLPSLTHDSL